MNTLRIVRNVWWLAVLGVVAIACGNDDGGPIGSGGDGCTIEASFSSIYANRLNTGTCASASCHDGNSVSAGLNFSKAPADVLADLVGVSSVSAPTKVRIVAGDADTSFFFEKLSNPAVEGVFGQMPPSGQLDNCELEAVRSWIDAGAQND